MRHRASTSLGRIVAVVATLCAWIAVSNHCALAMVASVKAEPKGAEVHSCCPAKPASPQDRPHERSESCCKVLRVLLPDAGSEKLATAHPETLLFELAWASEGASLEGTSAATEWSAVGPPEARSFAELVLQRSVRSHAPPVVG